MTVGCPNLCMQQQQRLLCVTSAGISIPCKTCPVISQGPLTARSCLMQPRC